MVQISHRTNSLIRFCVTAAVLAAQEVPSYAQQLGKGSAETDLSLWRVLATLVFLLILVAIAGILIKMRGRPLQIFSPANARQIEIVEVARISAQSSLLLVRFNGSEYLLAITPDGTTIVDKRPAKPPSSAESG